MQYFSSISDRTLSTISYSDAHDGKSVVTADELVVLLDCDHPTSGAARYRLDGIDEVIIGRGSRREAVRLDRRLTLNLPDGRISSSHAALRREGSSFVLEDFGSKNGVLMNGVRTPRHVLRDGNIFECGRTFLRFRAAVARPAAEPIDLDSAECEELDPARLTFHEPLAKQMRRLDDIARSNLPVLILGASGTGKELIARAIHKLSQRRGEFVGVNCGALPENLVEAELFGARRGAFTGATEERPGLIRSSHQGTLFLDEVGELAERAQPTLLRALQECEVLAVGATRPVSVDLRLVTATHRDLHLLVERTTFRADLLARISGMVIELPTLRDRLDDLGFLIGSLLARHVRRGGAAPTITPAAMRLMLRYPWPLNVRELDHALRAAMTLSSERIDVEHLPTAMRDRSSSVARSSTQHQRLWTPEQQARREELLALLTAHRGNISEVARRMNRERVQIRRWIRMFGISLDDLET